MVPSKYEQDPSLGKWVTNQRTNHINNNIRRDRKELLDNIGFAWKIYILAASRASTPDVRSRVFGSFHALRRSCFSFSFFFRLFV
jgi:site-specific DNA-cytosine methylase